MKILSVATTVALGIALTPLCAPVEASTQFMFTGQFMLLSAIANAEATLTLTDAYSFGSPITPANFVSLSILPVTTRVRSPKSQHPPGIHSDGSVVGELKLVSNEMIIPVVGAHFNIIFIVDPDGSWNWNDIGGIVVDGADSSGQFSLVVGSAVPEFSTWALMLLGFAALGYAGYRASRAGVAPQV